MLSVLRLSPLVGVFRSPVNPNRFLNYNELSTVPRGLFKGLVSLKEL